MNRILCYFISVRGCFFAICSVLTKFICFDPIFTISIMLIYAPYELIKHTLFITYSIKNNINIIKRKFI